MAWSLDRLTALRRGDVGLLIRATAALTAARVGLSVLGFDEVHRFAATMPRATTAGSHGSDRIAWAVGAIARRIPGTHCLPQAVAALALLRREGIDAELRVGIAHDSAHEVIGHAWVEHDGDVIIGETDEQYSPFPIDASESRHER